MVGLGDLIAGMLSTVGVTKDRASRWILAAKHWPEVPVVYLNYKADCGCVKRQEALNRIGWAMQQKLNGFGWWLKHRWTWLRSRR